MKEMSHTNEVWYDLPGAGRAPDVSTKLLCCYGLIGWCDKDAREVSRVAQASTGEFQIVFHLLHSQLQGEDPSTETGQGLNWV